MRPDVRDRIARVLLFVAIGILVVQLATMLMEPKPSWARGWIVPPVVLIVIAIAMRKRRQRAG